MARTALPWSALVGTWLLAQATAAGTVTVNLSSAAAADDQDAAVIVFDPLDATPPAAHDTVTIDQINKHFKPRISVIRTGTAVTFPNHDSMHHEVYSSSSPHRFKLKLYAGSPRVVETFDKPGLVILGCNIHDKMEAFVAVVDSPYSAIVPLAGSATLNLPAGNYRLRAWHPKLKSPFALTIAVRAEALTLPVALALDYQREDVAPLAD